MVGELRADVVPTSASMGGLSTTAVSRMCGMGQPVGRNLRKVYDLWYVVKPRTVVGEFRHAWTLTTVV